MSPADTFTELTAAAYVTVKNSGRVGRVDGRQAGWTAGWTDCYVTCFTGSLKWPPTG